jgi:hypothetical protein
VNPPTALGALFLGGQPGLPPGLQQVFLSAYRTSAVRWRARLGFAYVTNAGLSLLLDEANTHPQWNITHTCWLVGLNRFISEPAAIDRVRSLPRSQVKVFFQGSQLTEKAIVQGRHFHAKIMAFSAGENESMACLHVSSANLTESAYGVRAQNYEAGALLEGKGLQRSAASDFHQWWDAAWNSSKTITEPLLLRYTQLRAEYLARNPTVLSELPPPSAAHIGAAECFWIESGQMSGLGGKPATSRNGIDLSEELAGYFGPVQQAIRSLRIAWNGNSRNDRHLSHKVTTFGVHQWRLSLPTQHQGGFIYLNHVIHFTRQQDAQGILFRLRVAPPNSPDHQRWLQAANSRGHLGVTGGGRTFGYY